MVCNSIQWFFRVHSSNCSVSFNFPVNSIIIKCCKHAFNSIIFSDNLAAADDFLAYYIHPETEVNLDAHCKPLPSLLLRIKWYSYCYKLFIEYFHCHFCRWLYLLACSKCSRAKFTCIMNKTHTIIIMNMETIILWYLFVVTILICWTTPNTMSGADALPHAYRVYYVAYLSQGTANLWCLFKIMN